MGGHEFEDLAGPALPALCVNPNAAFGLNVTPSYVRTSGILDNQLIPAFGSMQVGNIRRNDIQAFVTKRAGIVSAASVVKELNILKHFLGLCVEWELIPVNPSPED